MLFYLHASAKVYYDGIRICESEAYKTRIEKVVLLTGCCCLYQKAHKRNGGEAHCVICRSSKLNVSDKL